VHSERVELVVSNPPYVAYSEIEALPVSVRDWEPPIALLSGRDGMAVIAAIVTESAPILAPGGLLALEVDERRAGLVAELVMASGNYIGVGVGLDLTGRERFVFASRN
jgi:release factor glutamine methyltransferase